MPGLPLQSKHSGCPTGNRRGRLCVGHSRKIVVIVEPRSYLWVSRARKTMKSTKLSKRRRTKLELAPELGEQILADVALGLSLKQACALAGVSDNTIRGWVTKGEKGASPELTRFANRYNAARVAPLKRAIDAIMTAIENGSVEAAKFWLTKLDPTRFGDKAEIEVRLSDILCIESAGSFIEGYALRSDWQIGAARRRTFGRVRPSS